MIAEWIQCAYQSEDDLYIGLKVLLAVIMKGFHLLRYNAL
jgi:hypothetical protein